MSSCENDLFIHRFKPMSNCITEFSELTRILRQEDKFLLEKNDYHSLAKYLSIVALLYDERNFIDVLKNERPN